MQQDAPSQVAKTRPARIEPVRRAQPTASTRRESSTAASTGLRRVRPDRRTRSKRPRKYRIHHLREMKNRGEKWAMLTAYDQYTAEIFDQAGIPVLLVGDSAANNVFGYESTLRVTVDELIPLARAVASAVERALVVADLPFGSYQASAEQAFHTAVRFMKEAGVHAVKLEGGRTVVPAVEKLIQAGIPVMAHIGFTPQSEHSIGGYRVQGRGDQAAALIDDAVALAEAGCVLGRTGDGARGCRRGDHQADPGPDDRHRRRPRHATRRCSSGRTWPASAPARCPASSSSTPTCAASSPAQPRPTPPK